MQTVSIAEYIFNYLDMVERIKTRSDRLGTHCSVDLEIFPRLFYKNYGHLFT